MAWHAIRLAAFVACVWLNAIAQENPFDATPESAAQADSSPSAEAQDQLSSAAPGRRLSAAPTGFQLAFKDSNGTDMQDGEQIENIEVSFTLGSSSGNANKVEITVPGSLFTVGTVLTVGSNGGRRLDGDAYGRQLSTACEVQSSTVVVCAANPSQTCLQMTLARSGGGDCQPGDVVTAATLTGANLPTVPAGNIAVVLQLYNGATAVPGAVASQVVEILTTAGIAISDPITFYKGKKTKFWLPLEGEHLLVQTPDLSIFASVFQGPRADLQWFDRFIIKLPDGRKVLEVGVKRESINQNKTTSRQYRMFSQLEVKLGNSQEPLRELKRTLYAFGGGAVKVGVGTQRFDPPRLHGQPITEFVNVETASISFYLVASHAGNEFDDLELQKKHAHLDWITHGMVGTEKFTGILPQIWGVQQPLSSEVSAMLQSPTESAQICVEV
jgi:hypothetical protein